MKATADPIFDGLDMDFSADQSVINAPAESTASHATDNSLIFNLDPVPVVVTPGAASSPAPDSGMLEFDMGSLSLDLDAPVTQSPTFAKAVVTAPAAFEGPLETKFALAEEFRALGDNDGARSLANEVVTQAQGALKTKAQAFLNALS